MALLIHAAVKLTLMCGKWRHSAFPWFSDQSSCKSVHCLSRNYRPYFPSVFFHLHPRGRTCRGGLTPGRLQTLFSRRPSWERSPRARSDSGGRSSASSGATELWLFTQKAKKLSSLCVCLEIKSSGTKGTMGTAKAFSTKGFFISFLHVCSLWRGDEEAPHERSCSNGDA